jgi:hypothetical protein
MHHDGKEKIADSVLFLLAYQTPYSCVSSEPVCTNDTRSIVAKSTEYPNWSAPPEGWIKLNTDGSFLAKDNSAGAGFIDRDHLGRCCLLLGYACNDAEDAEAKAALLGIKMLADKYQSKVILELDCASAVVTLCSHEETGQDYGAHMTTASPCWGASKGTKFSAPFH